MILLGGAPKSGKSTLARSLSLELGHDVVATDDLGAAVHAGAKADGEVEPDYREQYVRRTPQALWSEALDRHRRLWPSIRAVVRERLEWGRPAIVEGWALLPEHVATLPDRPAFALWLVVPPDTVELRARSDVDFYAGAADPDLMVRNFVARGELYNEHVRQTARAHRLPVIHVASEPLMQTVRRIVALVSDGPEEPTT